MPDLFVGIDGGGTHSTALAAYPDGRIAGIAYGGGMNWHNIGTDAVKHNLSAIVSELCEKTGTCAPAVCAGMAALDAPADAKTTAFFAGGLPRAGMLDLQSDAYAALMSHTMGGAGTIVICGTGSMLLQADRNGGCRARGGWGYLLGDSGSGYWLARAGLIAAADCADGFGGDGGLLLDALTYFGKKEARELIDAVYAPETTPDRIAGFARQVLARFAAGEETAARIVREGMEGLALRTANLLSRAPEAADVGLYGGIFAHSDGAKAIFTETLQKACPEAKVTFLTRPPEFGALAAAFAKFGSGVPERLKTNYEEYDRT